MNNNQTGVRAQNSQRRRQKIVVAALSCFIEKGFHASSMRDIASAADVSLGNLYNHFANKDALILEIATLEAIDFDKLTTYLEVEGTYLERLTHFTRKYLDYSSDPDDVALTAEITAEAVRNPAIAADFARNRRSIAGSVAAHIQAGIDCGEFNPSVKSSEAAELLLDLVEGVAFRIAVLDRPRSREAVDALESLLRRWLAASD